jgi:hypothetical protein
MALLEGVHCYHFGMEVASKVRKQNGVSALLKNVPFRVDEHGAHAKVTGPRSC